MKISVCIATYNGEKYIRQQLESILCQLTDRDEVIVSDDGSSDSTCDIIESLNDKRITLLHNSSHNIKWNFQNALEHISGDIVFLSDQDDVWLPGKVERCVSLLDDYDLVVHDSKLCDSDLNITHESFFAFYHSGPGVLKNAINNTYFGACMAMQAWIVKTALPLPKTQEVGHDIWLGLVAEMVGRVYFLNEPYLLYRRHNSAHTNLSESLLHRSKRPLATKIWSRVVVLKEVILFYLKHYYAK